MICVQWLAGETAQLSFESGRGMVLSSYGPSTVFEVANTEPELWRYARSPHLPAIRLKKPIQVLVDAS